MGRGWERKKDPSAPAVRKGRDPEVVRSPTGTRRVPLRETVSNNEKGGERK